MIIEALFPELCNLFGDAMNVEFLHRILPDAQLVKTPIKSQPAFTDKSVDFIYLGSMTENGQSIAAKALMPYREKILDLIQSDTMFLVTGNAMELFGMGIENEDSSCVETLKIFNLRAKRRMMNRYSSIYLGEFYPKEHPAIYDSNTLVAKSDGDRPDGKKSDDSKSDGDKPIEIVGFKSQFSHSYGDSNDITPVLFNTIRGAGRSPKDKNEGVRMYNFFATYILGPILVLNPHFTKYLLGLLGVQDIALPYEKEILTAYNARLSEFRDPKTGAEYG